MLIRPLTAADLDWVKKVVTEHIGSPRVVSRGVLHDALTLPGLIAELDSEPVGLLQYRMIDEDAEVVILISLHRRRGIARRLMQAMQEIARQEVCRRLWLVTTNNNQAAIATYHALGLTQVAVYEGAVRESRRLKPEIPEVDEQGKPMEDEIEFEYRIEIDESGPPDGGGRS